MVPDPRSDDAREAARLARLVLARAVARGAPGGAGPAGAGPAGAAAFDAARAALADAGLLDPSLPDVVRVEVLREGGLVSCAFGLSLAADPLGRAAALCGAGEALAETGMAYARDRVVFGRPLARMPVQRYAFASVAAAVEAATALVRRVAAGAGTPLDADALLPAALDAAWAAAEAALQVHGGYGYTDDFPVSRMWSEVAAARATLV